MEEKKICLDGHCVIEEREVCPNCGHPLERRRCWTCPQCQFEECS